MATVGIYDSGIGGLTVLKLILNKFPGNDAIYMADNLHHPFGSKSTEELLPIIRAALHSLREVSNVVAFACNTASTAYDGDDVIKLLPPDGNDFATSSNAPHTLLLATDSTLSRLSKQRGIAYANTGELATLIEREADKCYIRGHLDMWGLEPYLRQVLTPYKGVRRVILGCSHYPYCKPQIAKILGVTRFSDGNAQLMEKLSTHIEPHPERAASVDFIFTGADESEKYRAILKIMMNGFA